MSASPYACVSVRRSIPNDEVYDFQAFKHLLPVCCQPPAGYCHAAQMHPFNLPEVWIRIIFDTGAEGTSISDPCASRILRAQEIAGFSARDCPLNGMSRMDPPQRFYSYSEGSKKGEGKVVDILGHLRIMTSVMDQLPPLLVRVVECQIDDILVSAPDCDFWGFDRPKEPIRSMCAKH